MALLCAGILALSPAGGQLAYAAETQEAQENAAPEIEITDSEEDTAEETTTSTDTGDTSTTENGGIDPKNLEGDDGDEAATGSTLTTAPETEDFAAQESTTDETSQTEDSVTGETSDHEGTQNADTGTEEIETEETTQKDPQWSLLPLEEKPAALILEDFSMSELQSVEVSYIVEHLQDPEGNYYDFSDTDQFVWTYYKDEYGKTIRDEYHVVNRDDTVDLSVFDNVTEGYKMELIVGDGTQLGNNVRYIVSVCFFRSILELNKIELYKQDAQGKRLEADIERAKNTDSGVELYVPGHQTGTEYYLGFTSDIINHPDFNVEVYTEEEYQKRLDDGWQNSSTITDSILNQKMWMKDQGYRTTLDEEDQRAFVIVIEDPETHDAYTTTKQTISIKGSSVHVDSSVWTREDGNLVRATALVDDSGDWRFYPIRGEEDSNTELHILKWIDGKEKNDEFYLVFNAHHDAYGDNAVNHIIFTCEGECSDVEDARAVAEDLTDQLFADPADKPFSGYKVKRKIRDTITILGTFSVFFDDGSVCQIAVGVIPDDTALSIPDWKDYYSQPVVGGQDPWFRVTGVKQGDRELDAYVVENGKSKTLDTYYGMGYQTLFVNEYLSEEELRALKPTFWVADSAKIRIRTNANQGAEEVSGVTEHDFTSPNEYYALFEGRQKNYIVEVVPKVHGPKLYVFGSDGTEYERNREIFLDDYYQYRHDILIANVGDQKLEGLSVRLENASHVKIDDYWTVGGDNNDTLEPFTSTEKTERYGELQNLAKVRVVSDGAGDIAGDLIISADGQEDVVIHLSGSAIQPVIRTTELTYAVKYVPYSYIISTSNMNEKVDVTYHLWGKLPSGMHFDTKTGELYGVPKETGAYPFTVTANYSDQSFEPSTQKLELEVKDNEDEIVFNTTDEGYEIIPEENGMTGYMGEQVSEYSFELDPENSSETFITSGDISEFEKLWINGVELKAGTDYVAEPGSTIANLFLDIIREKGILRNGRNTISAEYKINDSRSSSAGSSSGSSSGSRTYDSWRSNGGGGGGSTVRRAAQNFRIGTSASLEPSAPKYFKISKTSANLHKGKTLTLKISRNYTTKIAWASTNIKVAKVNGNGKVTAVGKGNCTIVAKSGDGRTQKCKIHVMIPVSTIKLNKTSMKLGAGKYETLKLTVTPADVDKRDFIWTSSNTKIATVNSSGRVKGISKGTCTITVKTPNGKKRTCKVTVYNIIAVKSVKLNATSKTLNKWATYTLKATIAPSNASNKTLKWYSSNTKVAKVNSSGKVTAVGPGKARIKVKTNNGKTASCLVTVKLVPVSGVRLKLDRLLLKKDYKTKLSAVILPSYASDKSVTWSSSDESIVTVANGEVTGIEEGTAVITVTSSNGKEASCEVTVVSPDTEIPDILLDRKMMEIETEKTGTLEASIVAPEGTDKTVLWESTRPDVAVVKDGVITAKKVGYTTIIARTVFNTVATCSVRVKLPPVAVTKITLDQSKVYLNPNYSDTKTAALTVKFTPSNATDKSVTWKSADESVAVVKDGVVLARKIGTTTITATTTNGKTAVCQVIVETGPKRIGSVQDLIRISKELGADYILTCDLNLSEQSWTPIGEYTEGFYGTFDGNGHKITGMQITAGGECGLFSSLRGTVKNLTLNGSIRVDANRSELYAGGICGNLSGGTIENCKVSVDLYCSNEKGGDTAIFCGGIAGRVSNGTIRGSLSYGLVDAEVKGSGSLIVNAGGVAGYVSDNSSIITCGSTGNVLGKATPNNPDQAVRVECGGAAGETASDVRITDCRSSGNIKANCADSHPVAAHSLLAAGGIAGVQADTVISSCDGNSKTQVSGPASLSFAFTGARAAVNAVTSLELNVSSKTLHVGGRFILNPAVCPSNATSSGVTIESMDTSVATVNNGVVKAVGEGETQIRVVSELYGWAEAVCVLTVLPNGPDDVNHIDVLAPGDGKFGVDHQIQCEEVIEPANAADKSLTWYSSDSSIASVDQNGLVTTHKAGEVTITAEASNGVYGEIRLTVLPIDIEIVGSTEFTAAQGEKILVPIRLYTDGTITPGDDEFNMAAAYRGPEENAETVLLAAFYIDAFVPFYRWYGNKATVSSYTINGNVVDAILEINTAGMEKVSGAKLIIGAYKNLDDMRSAIAIITIE